MFKRKTVDNVLSAFTKTVKALDTIAAQADADAEATAAHDRAHKAMQDAQDARSEASRARIAASRIASLTA